MVGIRVGVLLLSLVESLLCLELGSLGLGRGRAVSSAQVLLGQNRRGKSHRDRRSLGGHRRCSVDVIYHRPIEIDVVVHICDVGVAWLRAHGGGISSTEAAELHPLHLRRTIRRRLPEFLSLHFHDKSERLGQEKWLLCLLKLRILLLAWVQRGLKIVIVLNRTCFWWSQMVWRSLWDGVVDLVLC